MRHAKYFLLPCILFVLSACQPAPGPQPARTVSVTGEGELQVAPEVANVRMAIEARARELEAAQSEAGRTVDAVLAITDALSIPRDAVQTTGLLVQPEFDWNDGRQTLRGYLVQREMRVTLQDLALLGPLLERAVGAGVNNVSPPELEVKDPRALHREALQAAARDARANAEILAKTLGAELGNVRRVSAGHVAMPEPKFEMQSMRAADSGRERNYESGRITVRADVEAEFEIR